MKKIDSWKKQFAIIYVGQAFSLLGSAAVQFAVIWWLTIQTESAMVLTLSTIVAFVPNMFIGPFAGVLVDRYNRKLVMMAADGLVALSSVILGLVFLINQAPPIWFIFVILFVRGIGNMFHSPAMQAAIPMLVPAEHLTKAGGYGNLINSLSNMLGPVLGAALMGVAPIATIMLIDIVGALFAIVCLLFVNISDIPRSVEMPHLSQDLKQGLGAMRENKPLMAVFFPMVMMNVIYMPLGTLFPLLVRTHFLGEAIHNSIVEFIFAGGLLISSLMIGVWGGMKNRFLMASLAVVLLGVTSLVSGILPATTLGFVIFAVVCFFMGMSGTFINVPVMAYVQESTAPEMMGKVFSLMMTAMTWSMPIGLLIAGPVCEVIGVGTWFFWSGVALVLTGILCRVLTRPYDQQTRLPEKKKKIVS
ncbi:DHA3 family macrolide efflux protein-like MFS transporter [Lachnospiraceae bacterium PF1-22]|uniref:MFS transporter n=1 Tax=Ohessyouella blattaphilus TaxID=2949333 RepID=UPI003E2B3298